VRLKGWGGGTFLGRLGDRRLDGIKSRLSGDPLGRGLGTPVIFVYGGTGGNRIPGQRDWQEVPVES
jgi:hypothetical protein